MPALYSAQAKFLSDKAIDLITHRKTGALIAGCRFILSRHHEHESVVDGSPETVKRAMDKLGFVKMSESADPFVDSIYDRWLYTRPITDGDNYIGIRLVSILGPRVDGRLTVARPNLITVVDYTITDGTNMETEVMAAQLARVEHGIVERQYGFTAAETRETFQRAIANARL